MSKKEIFKICKELGCCDVCCLRYLSTKIQIAYENPQKYLLQFQDKAETEEPSTPKVDASAIDEISGIDSVDSCQVDVSENKNSEATNDNVVVKEDEKSVKDDSVKVYSNGDSHSDTNGSECPPSKRRRVDVCTSCLGILQESSWPQCIDMIIEELEKKKYECEAFACALSAPVAVMLREKIITLVLKERVPAFDSGSMPALKEVWRWSFGRALSLRPPPLPLRSGADAALLATVALDYADEPQELEWVRRAAPARFAARPPRDRFVVEFTRRAVEQALSDLTLKSWAAATASQEGAAVPPAATATARCVSVTSAHAPAYLAGRYIKLSRSLPQSPWVLRGERMMPSSVQEIIFEPLAGLFGIPPSEADRRLKFISAGREDVDVRCLGEGRPFAIEVMDPRRTMSSAELERVCREVSSGGKVGVMELVYIDREELTYLKQGEETKCKTYEALCVKLGHSKRDKLPPDAPITVTPEDIAAMNAYSNTPAGDPARVRVKQRTPIRVLHRRPLLDRERDILDLEAGAVEGHPSLFTLRIRTSAGTYVKEWVHGDLRRTRPGLEAALGAPADLLALDVAAVELDWPRISNKGLK